MGCTGSQPATPVLYMQRNPLHRRYAWRSELMTVVERDALLTCPITHELFKDPVVAGDGFTYERAAIQRWMRRSSRSPMTNDDTLAGRQLLPNHVVRHLVAAVHEAAPRSESGVF